MYRVYIVILVIIIITLFILLHNQLKGTKKDINKGIEKDSKKDSNKESFKCVQNYVNYNDYCDINECDNICDPSRLYCNPMLNKCRWNEPQKANSNCVKNNECLSGVCYYDKSGKNSGIGYCL